MSEQSLQQQFFKQGICFGCGPANEKGLRINSIPQGDKVICDWQPEAYHQAFEGVLNGGIIGALLDCHCNWTAAYHLMQRLKQDHPPCTVGWVSHWNEMLSNPYRIGRPRQLYTGAKQRDFVAMDKR